VCVYEQRERVALGVSCVDVMEWVAHLGREVWCVCMNSVRGWRWE
jgi:hypothetical protein